MVHIISGSLTFVPAKPHHRYLGGYADTEQEAVPDPRAGRYVEFHLSHIVPAADEAAVESFDDGGGKEFSYPHDQRPSQLYPALL